MNWLSVWSVLKDLNPFKFLRTELEKRDLSTRNSVLEEKNVALERKLEELESRHAERYHYSGYLFFADDDTPRCATCYQNRDKTISLKPPERWQGGIRRVCPVCRRDYWDGPPPQVTVPTPDYAPPS